MMEVLTRKGFSKEEEERKGGLESVQTGLNAQFEEDQRGKFVGKKERRKKGGIVYREREIEEMEERKVCLCVCVRQPP